MNRSSILTVSILVHVGAAIGLGTIQAKENRKPTAIELANIPQQERPKADEPPPPPPPPAPAPKPRPAARAPVPQAPLRAEALKAFENLPDFGFSLEGSVGASGVAVPIRPASLGAPAVQVTKPLAAPLDLVGTGACRTHTKPKPVHVPRPEYPRAAIGASTGGRVRLQLEVDTAGQVLAVSVLEGLGHGFDEAAVAAAKRARFEPARSCGKPAPGRFTISMRFSAS